MTSADGTRIAMDRTGSGPPLVLVGGALSTRDAGIPLTEEVQSEYTVYRYDRRGRGDSGDTPPYRVEREIEDLAAVIEAADGSAFVYGNSSGAVLALRAAEAGLPIRRLGLFEPPFVGGDPDAIPKISRFLDEEDRAGAIRFFLISIGVPAEMVDASADPALEALAHTIVYDLTITGDNDGLVPVDRLARIDAPALVISSTGSAEPMREAAQATADLLPNGVYRSLAGGWHGVPDADLADLIKQFFVE
nr:alpha/beta hydrolase [Stackebrandtia endophytica]